MNSTPTITRACHVRNCVCFAKPGSEACAVHHRYHKLDQQKRVTRPPDMTARGLPEFTGDRRTARIEWSPREERRHDSRA